jgi:hypothetical protein
MKGEYYLNGSYRNWMEGVDWIRLTQVGTRGVLCEHGNEP